MPETGYRAVFDTEDSRPVRREQSTGDEQRGLLLPASLARYVSEVRRWSRTCGDAQKYKTTIQLWDKLQETDRPTSQRQMMKSYLENASQRDECRRALAGPRHGQVHKHCCAGLAKLRDWAVPGDAAGA
jgi:hypothetical protein